MGQLFYAPDKARFILNAHEKAQFLQKRHPPPHTHTQDDDRIVLIITTTTTGVGK